DRSGDLDHGVDGRKLIAILLFDGVEELDAVGPWEVLAAWASLTPECGYQVVCVSMDGQPVMGAKGLQLGAHMSVAEAEPIEVLIYPGGQGTRSLVTDEAHLAWLRGLGDRTPLLTSVCTGALVYGAAGLLHGRPATTHWASLTTLSELDPTIDLRSHDRWVDDGDVITSAGVSAGIDMALHLVARLADDQTAAEVRRWIQYEPDPPV
ncbi:MAG: DJ-1/PfpI family protein, partial [Candidatus Nanopelagicales bacterium]